MDISVLHLDFEKTFRGSENQLLLLHERLLGDGIPSFVLALEGGDMIKTALEKNLPNLMTVKEPPFSLGELNPWLAASILSALKKTKANILHARGAHSSGILCFMRPLLPKDVKLVFHRTVSNPIRFYSGYKYAAADGVIVVCKAIQEDLVSHGVKQEKIQIIPSGVPMGDCASEEEEHGGTKRFGDKVKVRQTDALVVGSLSALDKLQKDVATLIRAFALIKDRFPQMKLMIAGDGPDRPALEQLTKDLGLQNRVDFRGWWSRPLEEALEEMDIFVLPSLYEGTSNVLITAMACGLPCIANDIGGNKEVLDDAGVLIPPKNPQALADAIARFAASFDLRKEYSVRAIGRAPQFSADYTARRTINFYEKLMK